MTDPRGTNRPAVDVAVREGTAAILESARDHEGLFAWAEADGDAERVVVAAPAADRRLVGLAGERHAADDLIVIRAERDATTLAALRRLLPNLTPRPLGLATSAGFGDRLGLATPGHVDALRAAGATSVAPIFAQQSMRENARTGRTPQEVVDDATWGAFLAGWSAPVGADADHLKSEADVDLCLAAGYSFFTIDPGAHVDAAADGMTGSALESAFAALPWADLDTTPADLRARLGGATLDTGDRAVSFGPGELERAAVKYGRAVAHVARLAGHLRRSATYPTELEVSVDETPTPTSLGEHLYFATELRRLGVEWVSLAPRFVGDFEKGVEYRGDLAALADHLRGHASIAAQLGPYKLSLHSGSDKFSVYAPAAQATGGLVHLKTAGTSYLEALRVIGAHEPELLHRIARLAAERFAEDVQSYHISGSPAGMPALASLPGTAVGALLEQTDARQVLHVTFGSALRTYGAEIGAALRHHPAAYRAALRRHFERHLAPLVTSSEETA